jgi:integrase/recombinase XerD
VNRFDDFIRHRQYLLNVSDNTISWYRHAFKWLPSQNPTQDELNGMVLRMREAGLKPTGCNAATRAINAYLHWASDPRGKCGGGCRHPHIKPMKEPDFLPVTFTAEQVKCFISWRPQGFHDRRLHLIVLLFLDTGARVSELLGLRVIDIDLDNLLLTIFGKGRKQRLIPFSIQLRGILFRWIRDCGKRSDDLVFSNTAGHCPGRNAFLRAVKHLCKRLKFNPPPRTLHAFRHTFSTNFVRCTGSPAKLQRLLGQTTITMAMRYVHLAVEDLQEGYEGVSLLNRR